MVQYDNQYCILYLNLSLENKIWNEQGITTRQSEMNSRKFIILCSFILSLCDCLKGKVINEFDKDWDVIDSKLSPKWHDRAKFGILIHFGVYSASKIGSEWFWYDWEKKKVPEICDFMKYRSSFHSYRDLAANFKPQFFNAEEWVDMVEKSGARYLAITAKHHDGFAMYNSSFSPDWNSVNVGPRTDFLAELKNATKIRKLKFGIFYSLMEWFHPLYLKDQVEGTQEFVDRKMIPELKELVENFQPDFIWSDGEWEMDEDYWKSPEFLLWLLSKSSVRNSVVVNDRWGTETLCKHGSYFTCSGKSKVLQDKKFENLISMDKLGWGFNVLNRVEDIMSVNELIYELVSTVACNGNLLLNVGANSDGIIENIYIERLQQLGIWLRVNGEGIYSTKPFWKQQDNENSIWYTTKIRGKFEEIFVFVLNYPYDSNEIELDEFVGIVNEDTEISLLGFTQKIEFYFKGEKLVIKFPEKRIIDQFELTHAWTLKVLNEKNMKGKFSRKVV